MPASTTPSTTTTSSTTTTGLTAILDTALQKWESEGQIFDVFSTERSFKHTESHDSGQSAELRLSLTEMTYRVFHYRVKNKFINFGLFI